MPSGNTWKSWNGGSRPVGLFVRVEIRLRGPCEEMTNEGEAGTFQWEHYQSPTDIIAYRIVNDSSLPSDTSLDLDRQYLANAYPEVSAPAKAAALDKELDSLIAEALDSRICSACYQPAIAYTFGALYSQPHNLCKDHLREMAKTYPQAIIVFYPRSMRRPR